MPAATDEIDTMANPLISVIIPVFNEERTLVELLERVDAERERGMTLEVIVIDDGSTDRTPALLADRPDLYSKLITCPRNGGKGAAVIRGLEAATGDYVLFQDADLEYHPADYEHLLEPVTRFSADVVLGSRFRSPGIARVNFFWHWVGNKCITLLFNMLNDTTFTDIYSCYLVFRRDLLDPRQLRRKGWAQHAEILGLLMRPARAIYEVPINYSSRSYEEGKKIRGYHVFAVIGTIVSTRFR